MVTGTIPFEGDGYLANGQTMIGTDKYYFLFSTNKEKYWKRYQNIGLSDELKKLIDIMLIANPIHRPTYSDILMHPWLLTANEEIT